MPINLIKPDATVTDMFRARLSGMASSRGFRTRALAAAPAESLNLAVPHPVFNLGLETIGRPGYLERAAMTGWRYLVTSGSTVIAGTEAQASHPRGEAVFTHTNEGAFVQSFSAEVERAEAWPEVKAGEYALGLLRVPALYVMALWLRDAQGRGDRDLFVPLAPAPAPLKAGVRLRADAFATALVELKGRKGSAGDASN